MSSAGNARQSKQERREAAREQAKKLREAQQRREKRNRILIIGGVLVFIAVVVVAVVSILTAANRSPVEDLESQPAGATENGGIQVGANGVGSTSTGAPTVEIYLDYLCPHCADLEMMNAGVLEGLAAAGDATVVYHPVAFLVGSSDFSLRGAQAFAVVADAAPDQLGDFNAGLFSAQGEGGGVPLSDDQIAEVGVQVGVPQEVVDTFTDGRFTDWVEAATTQATDDITGTPTVLIDGTEFTDWGTPGALEQAVLDAG